jgi:hypothetical protein
MQKTFRHSQKTKTFFTICFHGPPLKSWAYGSWAIALEVATLKLRIVMQKYKRMPPSESFPNFDIPTWPVDYVGIERKFQLPNIKHHQNF